MDARQAGQPGAMSVYAQLAPPLRVITGPVWLSTKYALANQPSR
jgi:hypothetical protein